MKICFVTNFIYQGGAHRWVIEMTRDAALRGHDVTLLTDFPTDEPLYYGRLPASVKLWTISPVRWTPTGPPHGWRWEVNRLRAFAAFARRNRRELLDFDIVHVVATRMVPYMHLLLRLASRAERPRFIETYTAYFEEYPRPVMEFMLRCFWPHFDAVSTGLESRGRRAVAARLPNVRMPIIPLGVAVPDVASWTADARTAYRRRAGIPDDARWVVGTVQRLHGTRRPWVLMAAFAEIAARLGEGVHFVIGGDGEARAQVEAEAEALGIRNRVHFLGSLQDVAPAFAIMDAHVIQTWYGAPGTAGYEAALARVPGVGVDFTSVPHEPLPDDLMWSHADPRAAGRRIAELLADPVALAHEADAQRQRAHAKVSLEASGAGYDALYHQVMAESVGRRGRSAVVTPTDA